MKKLLFIFILAPSMLIAQNACKTCSEFSKSKEWSQFMKCVTKEIEKTSEGSFKLLNKNNLFN